jgi:uncharacterized membrane protein
VAQDRGLALGGKRTRVRGLAAVGWGLFNVVEGIVDHHVLGIDHVREGANETAWDLAFLAFGALLVAGGWLLARSEERRLAELR